MSGLAYEAVIVGGGPAGLNAALVLGRCLRRVLVCDSGRYRNERAGALHCFMGHDGIPPTALLEQGRRELRAYETVSLVQAKVTALSLSGSMFEVQVAGGELVTTRTLLVATGVVDEVPDIDGIEDLYGRSVHVCPYCDGWEHRKGAVAVYGRGEKGVSLALLLRQWTDDLALCTGGSAHLSDEQGCRLRQRGIQVCEEAIARLEGSEGRLRAIWFEDGSVLARQALFFNTGQHPRSPLLTRLGCDFDQNGGVVCDENGETSVPGVFVAGDVSRDVQLAIIAAAEGARAALAINKHLSRVDGHL
jgi:thioredoxin reductase